MNVNVRYGNFGYCEISIEQYSVLLNEEEDKVVLGLQFLDYAIELISNTTKTENKLPQELLELARREIQA